MNMVEKVTHAIMRAHFSRPVDDQIINASPVDNEDLARAAIAAMREPTNDQANEYYKIRKAAGDVHSSAVFNVSVWESSIDAALKE